MTEGRACSFFHFPEDFFPGSENTRILAALEHLPSKKKAREEII